MERLRKSRLDIRVALIAEIWLLRFERDRLRFELVHAVAAGATDKSLAMGGPLVKGRTFYYAAFEQEYNRALEDSFISPAVASSINRILASGAFPRLATQQINDGFFPTARAETEASAPAEDPPAAAANRAGLPIAIAD